MVPSTLCCWNWRWFCHKRRRIDYFLLEQVWDENLNDSEWASLFEMAAGSLRLTLVFLVLKELNLETSIFRQCLEMFQVGIFQKLFVHYKVSKFKNLSTQIFQYST